ncbi:YtxH domain-containing protein [Lysinibacillus sp. NPDC096418]|uniref:YtxH domain-containing protein n=1 Tax=Lysinibacillus sp. NPDC096418 TaxID=3364138 RepID=UPI003829A9AE
MKAKPFLIGLTAGIVGGTIAILFSTPQSGQQLRATLKSTTDSTKGKFQDVKLQVNNVKDSVNTLTNEAKNNIPQIINDLKQSINTFSAEIEPTKNNLQQEIEALQNSIGVIEKNIAQYTDKKKKSQEK